MNGTGSCIDLQGAANPAAYCKQWKRSEAASARYLLLVGRRDLNIKLNEYRPKNCWCNGGGATLQHCVGRRPGQRQPLLIRIDTKSGHGAGKPTAKAIQEEAHIFSFIAETLGLSWRD
ncbi:UNVERIFIED_CONTAM: hypothetical protein FKN15_058345 [Acipenser sinensis]